MFEDPFQEEGNAENAFSYHMLARELEPGELVTQAEVSDIQGPADNPVIADYSNHLEAFAMQREGDRTIYEFSVKVYSDQYNHSDPASSRSSLQLGQSLGFAVSLCDNDQDDGVMDHYLGSVPVIAGKGGLPTVNADYLGLIILDEILDSFNQPVVVTGSIPDFEITEKETSLVIIGSIGALFDDPDGDPLGYSILEEDGLLELNIEGDTLRVWAGLAYEGETEIALVATDGEFSDTIRFTVFAEETVIDDKEQLGPGIKLYPEVFEEVFYLEFDLGNEEEVTAECWLFSLDGMLSLAEMYSLMPGGKTVVSISWPEAFPSLYVVEVKINGQTYSTLIRKR
jgi:hypothetical protein